MDNSASLWRTESSAHTAHRTGRVLPSYVPRFGVVSHRGCWQFRVTAFTRRSDRARDVAEQWTVMWRSRPLLGTTAPNLWAEPWTKLRTGCGRSLCPHPVEIVRPRIHSPLSWADVQPPDSLWTQLGTTSQSPACGRKKVGKSVEGGRNPAGNRTQGCWWDTGFGRRGGAAEGSSGSDRGFGRGSAGFLGSFGGRSRGPGGCSETGFGGGRSWVRAGARRRIWGPGHAARVGVTRRGAGEEDGGGGGRGMVRAPGGRGVVRLRLSAGDTRASGGL